MQGSKGGVLDTFPPCGKCNSTRVGPDGSVVVCYDCGAVITNGKE